jgi:cytochrome P450
MLMEDMDQSQAEMIKEVTAAVYMAGTDTTVAAVVAFFLAMLIYPDVQDKAQAEVDHVVGRDRLPELEDRKQMPYVEGVVNECLRWLPVLPVGEHTSAARTWVSSHATCSHSAPRHSRRPI